MTNKKHSHLTPEQQKLVRSPKFIAWFGDWIAAYNTAGLDFSNPAWDGVSKVVDENGEPLVVYHGTTKNFTIFDKKYATKNTKVRHGYLGFFFTPNFDLAIDFTRKKWFDRISKHKSDWYYAMQCFLTIKNPKITSARGFTMMNTDKNTQGMLIENNYDGVFIEKWIKEDKESWIRLFGEKGTNEFDYNQYITFYSNQIKLADGANTQFDISNPDIRYEKGGKIDNKVLSERIQLFLDKYAGISPDWDGESDDNKYTSPDASMMKYCADMLGQGLKPDTCWSEWGSGGYKPYSSKEGKKEHDYLVAEIYKIINSKDSMHSGGEVTDTIALQDWYENYETIINNNKDKSIILYHGSFNPIIETRDASINNFGIYFTPDFTEANNYIIMQSDYKDGGDYGYMYKVEIPLKDIELVDLIDNAEIYNNPIYSPEEKYFRIDKISKYKLQSVDNDWIIKNWDNPVVSLIKKNDSMHSGGEVKTDIWNMKLSEFLNLKIF